jgi:hypothetical protein
MEPFSPHNATGTSSRMAGYDRKSAYDDFGDDAEASRDRYSQLHDDHQDTLSPLSVDPSEKDRSGLRRGPSKASALSISRYTYVDEEFNVYSNRKLKSPSNPQVPLVYDAADAGGTQPTFQDLGILLALISLREA